jgi:hypothetical protein
MREGEVIVQIDGKSYSGSFIVDRGIMTVSVGVNSKTSPVGEMALEVRARLMLRDMVLYPTRPPPEGNHNRKATPPVGGGSAATGLVSTYRWQAPLELLEGPAE